MNHHAIARAFASLALLAVSSLARADKRVTPGDAEV
jgi:hypothetical protein